MFLKRAYSFSFLPTSLDDQNGGQTSRIRFVRIHTKRIRHKQKALYNKHFVFLLLTSIGRLILVHSLSSQ